MKKYLLASALVLLSVPALADNVTIVHDDNAKVVRTLPGNAQVVTGNGDTVVIQGDDDVWRRMVLGPQVRVYQNGGTNTLAATCPNTLSKGDYRRCVKDFTDAQEKIRKRYND